MLEKHKNHSATLHFHSKITSDNRLYGGIHPIAAHESHQKSLSSLVKEALESVPMLPPATADLGTAAFVKGNGVGTRQKPDFVTVTRGPGMRASLTTGLDTAKGLAVAWQVPLLGVNHMQAHALTPRLLSALDAAISGEVVHFNDPAFPFLTLLVSGGHTMLVYSRALCDHRILANTTDIAIGDTIDKCARDILPASVVSSAANVMYGSLLESYAFPKHEATYSYNPPSSFTRPRDAKQEGYDWVMNPPYSAPGPMRSTGHADSFSYSGIGSSVKRILGKRPEMGDTERQILAKKAMEVAFEHLASRVLFALERSDLEEVNTLVVSGGVASNHFLKFVLRTVLDVNGYGGMRLMFPPPKFCTDNAAMIAWTGIEMFEAGWRTKLDVMAVRKWSIDSNAEDGGILGIDGWDKPILTPNSEPQT